MQKTYMSDHLSAIQDQDASVVARRSESNRDYLDGTAMLKGIIMSYSMSKPPTPEQRNYMRDYLSSPFLSGRNRQSRLL